MLPYILLAVLLGLPLAVGLFFRVNVSHIFFSVMTGELLGRYFGHAVEDFFGQTFQSDTLTHYAEAIVITLPIVLTAIFLKGSVGRSRSVLNILPLVITGIVYAAFMLPILPSDIQAQVQTVPLGKDLFDTSSVIIGGVVLVQLVTLWLVERSGESGKRKKKRD